MTPDQLDALLKQRRLAIDASRAAQVAELKAQQRGPWAPPLTIAKRRPRKKPAAVVPMRKVG